MLPHETGLNFRLPIFTNGRRSGEKHAQSQQYLNPEEEKAMVRFLLLMSGLGHPVRIISYRR
jgi:hypothetical protein